MTDPSENKREGEITPETKYVQQWLLNENRK